MTAEEMRKRNEWRTASWAFFLKNDVHRVERCALKYGRGKRKHIRKNGLGDKRDFGGDTGKHERSDAASRQMD